MELVIDGSQMTYDKWEKMYPPHVPECKSLPGQGKPFWLYTWNYCVSCKNVLTQCKHNPFAIDGKIAKERRAKISYIPQVIEPVIIERPESQKGKRGRIKRTIDITEELIAKALTMVKAGNGAVAVAKELNVNYVELSTALKSSGFIPKKGRKPKTQ